MKEKKVVDFLVHQGINKEEEKRFVGVLCY